MCQGTGPQGQQPPSQAIAPVPPVVPPPSPQKSPRNSTSDIVDSLNQIKLTNEVTTSAKKSKQHYSMDFETDHPKLNGSQQTGNTNANPPQLSLQGGQQ